MATPPAPAKPMGRYIVIEGAPGSGTSVQLELLARRLRENKYKVQLFAQAPNLENALEQANSIQTAKQEGFITLRKRFELTPAILAYYGSEGSDYSIVNNTLTQSSQNKPDMVIVLDAPAATLYERAAKKIIEGEKPPFTANQLERIRIGYLWEAKQRGYHVINAALPPELVHQDIWQLLREGPQPEPPADPPPIFGEPTPIKTVLEEKQKAIQSSPIKARPTTANKTIAPLSPADMLIERISLRAALEIGQHNPSQYREEASHTANNEVEYYIPPNLSESLKNAYTLTLQQIFKSHGELTKKLAAHISASARLPESRISDKFIAAANSQAQEITSALLPLATYTNLHIVPAFKSPLPDTIPEIRSIAAKYSGQEGNLSSFRSIISKDLPSSLGTMDKDVQLSQVWPRNELDLLPAMLYSSTGMNFQHISGAVNKWPYEQKALAFNAYRGNAFELARYAWDIQGDYAALRSFLQAKINAFISVQEPTARYGFDIPEIIEQANLADEYETCFDISAELYSKLQAEGYEEEAGYVVLLGHRTRWAMSISAPELFHLYSQKQDFANRKLLKDMYERVAEVHPLLSEVLLANNG